MYDTYNSAIARIIIPELFTFAAKVEDIIDERPGRDSYQRCNTTRRVNIEMTLCITMNK